MQHLIELNHSKTVLSLLFSCNFQLPLLQLNDLFTNYFYSPRCALDVKQGIGNHTLTLQLISGFLVFFLTKVKKFNQV